MYALRERRVHVTQEDFEMAVAKVSAVGEAKLGGADGGFLPERGAVSGAQTVLGSICQDLGAVKLEWGGGVTSGDKQQR